MAETLAVNILSYQPKTSNASDLMTKSNDKSNDFNDIFENINKNYDSDKSTSSSSLKNKNIDDNKNIKDNNKTENIKEKNEVKDNPKTDDNKNVNDKQDQSNEKVTNSDNNTKKEADNQKINPEDQNQNQNANNKQAESENKENLGEIISTVAKDIHDSVIAAKDAVLSSLDSLINASGVVDLSNVAQISNIQSAYQQQASDNNISSLNLNLASSNNMSIPQNIAQLQSQTQPRLANLNIPPQDVPMQSQGQVEMPSQLITEATITNSPLIQVSEDVQATLNSDMIAKVEDPASAKNIVQKAITSQEIIDKTNARVVSVETSTSSDSSGFANSNNMMSSNAQEQSVKLSLENSDEIKTSDNTFQSAQVNIAKPIESLNNISESKEISKTEILSQINKQLDVLKDDPTTTKVNIVLKPENLGKITLELISGQDGLTAKMTTENAQIKEILDKSLNALKDTLGSQGVNVNSVSVKVEETQKQSNDMFSQNWNQNNSNQQSGNNENNSSGNRFAQKSKFETDIDDFHADAEIDSIEDELVLTDPSSQEVDYKV